MSDLHRDVGQFLWDRGFGRNRAIQAENFLAYLASIPQIPASLLADDPDLPLLSLADPRPGLLRNCRLLGIQFDELGYKDGDAVPFDERFVLPTAPFWFRHDDGRTNRNRRPDHCRDALTGDIQAGTAMEGIFALTHHPSIGEHIMDLPGTVNGSMRVDCAFLSVSDGRVELSLLRKFDLAHPDCWTLRVRRK